MSASSQRLSFVMYTRITNKNKQKIPPFHKIHQKIQLTHTSTTPPLLSNDNPNKNPQIQFAPIAQW